MAIRTSARKSGAWESKTASADDGPPVSFDLKRGLGDNSRGKEKLERDTGAGREE